MSDLFPLATPEIRDLLSSAEWEEVNQGLELLVSTCGTDQLAAFASLIDPSQLQIRDPVRWHSALGISDVHTLNAVAKLAALSGLLASTKSITVQAIAFANSGLCLDLSLLAEAESLEELVINGVELSGLGALSGLVFLKKLVLISDCCYWDRDADAGCFESLTQLGLLAISNWPWNDLTPLASCTNLEQLILRAGALESTRGLDRLSSLRSLTLADIPSLCILNGIGLLTNLNRLTLRNLPISSLEDVAQLSQLESFAIVSYEPVDVAALGTIPALQRVAIFCSQPTGLGALAACSRLNSVWLGHIFAYHCGDAESRCKLSSDELGSLMRAWKSVHTLPSAVSLYAEASDIAVLLLGLNLLECISAQISIKQFQQRLKLLCDGFGDQLSSRCYWPVPAGDHSRYSKTHPVGQWMERSFRAGAISADHCAELATILAEYLPTTPQR